MSDTINLTTSYDIRHFKDIKELNPRLVEQKLLTKRYETLILKGFSIDKFAIEILLSVENDVQFLIEDYLYLEDVLMKQKAFEHYSFLNDGLLQIEARNDETIVDVTYNYCPGLNVANLVRYNERITKEMYWWWWRGIAYDLLNHLN